MGERFSAFHSGVREDLVVVGMHRRFYLPRVFSIEGEVVRLIFYDEKFWKFLLSVAVASALTNV